MRILCCIIVALWSPILVACDFSGIHFLHDFPGARLDGCRQVDDTHFVLTIKPEATPINDSPWYAFKVISDTNRTLQVTLEFIDGPARYSPKRSSDGKTWATIAYDKTEQTLQFSLDVDKQPTWIAAQELLLPADYHQWLEQHATRQSVTVRTVGHSSEGRPIESLEVGKVNRDTVIILGRQHPPEVSGALALFPFVETLLGDGETAKAFRQRFFVVVIPAINPDGVVHGNWRLNQQGIDTNRDWGPFTQPETTAVHAYLEKLVTEGHRFYLGLDFHSTKGNYFYTQKDQDPLCPPAFTRNWTDDIKNQLPAFQFKRSSRTSDGNPTFKQWFNTTYGVPSISYEMDDNIDRDLIVRVARTAVTAMMRELLNSQCAVDN